MKKNFHLMTQNRVILMSVLCTSHFLPPIALFDDKKNRDTLFVKKRVVDKRNGGSTVFRKQQNARLA